MNVGTGDKGFITGTRQDEHTYLRVLFHLGQNLIDLLDRGVIDRIAFVGPVNGQFCDCVVDRRDIRRQARDGDRGRMV